MFGKQGVNKLTKEELKKAIEKLNEENINRFSDFLKEKQDTCQQRPCPYQKEKNT